MVGTPLGAFVALIVLVALGRPCFCRKADVGVRHHRRFDFADGRDRGDEHGSAIGIPAFVDDLSIDPRDLIDADGAASTSAVGAMGAGRGLPLQVVSSRCAE